MDNGNVIIKRKTHMQKLQKSKNTNEGKEISLRQGRFAGSFLVLYEQYQRWKKEIVYTL